MHEKGHILLREAAPPRSVTLQRYSTVLVAGLEFASVTRTLVIKPFVPARHNLSLEALGGVHEAIRSKDEVLARVLPQLFGYDAFANVIVMEFIPGSTLQDLLSGWFPRCRQVAEGPILQSVARGLAHLHRLDAHDVGVHGEHRSNDSFLDNFEDSWNDPLIRSFVPAPFEDVHRFVDRLGVGFADRVGRSVLMSDAQLKNIVVSPDNSAHFVDIDYKCGNPAIELAQLLCSIDLLRVRHPLSFSTGRIFKLKQAFLSSYFRYGERAVGQDLVFFYPYVLLRAFRGHVNSRPWFRRYLIRCYGRRLNHFLSNYEVGSLPWRSCLK